MIPSVGDVGSIGCSIGEATTELWVELWLELWALELEVISGVAEDKNNDQPDLHQEAEATRQRLHQMIDELIDLFLLALDED